MGRASKEVAAENRAKVVAMASDLFRQKGTDGVGIAELMGAAGLTHGGFYKQFGSRDALAGEACTHAFDGAERTWAGLAEGDDAGRLQRITERYFSASQHGRRCPMVTLSIDAARAPVSSPLRKAFADGLRRLASVITRQRRDDQALAVLAAMVGAVVLRRASHDAELSGAIDEAVSRLAASYDHRSTT